MILLISVTLLRVTVPCYIGAPVTTVTLCSRHSTFILFKTVTHKRRYFKTEHLCNATCRLNYHTINIYKHCLLIKFVIYCRGFM